MVVSPLIIHQFSPHIPLPTIFSPLISFPQFLSCIQNQLTSNALTLFCPNVQKRILISTNDTFVFFLAVRKGRSGTAPKKARREKPNKQ